MILTKPMPATTWIPDGARGSFVNGPERLTDGKPARRLVYDSVMPAGVFDITGTWTGAMRPGVIALLGMSDAFADADFTIFGISSTLGSFLLGLSLRARRLQDGTLALILTPAPTDYTFDIDGLQIQCFGTAARYEIGQIHIAEAETWQITRDWTEGRVINSKLNTTPNGQPSRVARLSAREASVSLAPVSDTAAYGAGRSLQALQFSLDQYRPVLCIPAPRGIGRGEAAPIDADFVYNTALFGYATNLGRLQVVQNSNLVQLSGLTFREAPARAG